MNSPNLLMTVENERAKSDPSVIDAHVVILNNYLCKHHAVTYSALAKRVRKLSILLSVEMEPHRNWEPEWLDLDVIVQKNWMYTAKSRYRAGFEEDNFIHIPIDTVSQLKRLKPDIVFSYEMGMRTLFSGWFRLFRSQIPLVMVGNMSENIEKDRGFLRRMMRGMVCRAVDAFSYNGPSCKRYLESLGIKEDKLHHIPYCIDPESVYKGDREPVRDDRPRRILYCGSISVRKGLVHMAESFGRYLDKNPERSIEFQLAGNGDQKEQLKALETDQLKITFLGNLDAEGLREANRNADIGTLPTYADEWGLTPIEHLASGIPVLGSWYAQSVEAVVKDDVNGWMFRTDDSEGLDRAVESAMSLSGPQLDAMVDVCRQSVAHISGPSAAQCFCDTIESLLPNVGYVK